IAGAGEAPASAAPPASVSAAGDPFDICPLGAAVIAAIIAPPAPATVPVVAAPPPSATVPVAAAAPPPAAAVPTAGSVGTALAPLVAEGGLEVVDRGDEAVLRLPTRSLFPSQASSDLGPQGRALVRRVAEALAGWPDRKVQIAGPLPSPAARFDGEAWQRA